MYIDIYIIYIYIYMYICIYMKMEGEEGRGRKRKDYVYICIHIYIYVYIYIYIYIYMKGPPCGSPRGAREIRAKTGTWKEGRGGGGRKKEGSKCQGMQEGRREGGKERKEGRKGNNGRKEQRKEQRKTYEGRKEGKRKEKRNVLVVHDGAEVLRPPAAPRQLRHQACLGLLFLGFPLVALVRIVLHSCVDEARPQHVNQLVDTLQLLFLNFCVNHKHRPLQQQQPLLQRVHLQGGQGAELEVQKRLVRLAGLVVVVGEAENVGPEVFLVHLFVQLRNLPVAFPLQRRGGEVHNDLAKDVVAEQVGEGVSLVAIEQDVLLHELDQLVLDLHLPPVPKTFNQ
jgi:hypothetical protein